MKWRLFAGLWGPAAVLVYLSFVRDDETLCVALLTLSVALNGCTYVGFNVSHLDLSPNYASTLFGITNAVANVMSLMAPLAVGFIVTDEVANLRHIAFPCFKAQPNTKK